MSQWGTDVDRSVEDAWREFRERLATALDELGDGSELRVRPDLGNEPRRAAEAGDVTDAGAPDVRVLRAGGSLVLEVSGNRTLPASRRLSQAARRQLRQLGLAKPGGDSPHYRATYPVRHVDQVASVTVAVLREAFGVLHPAFLRSDDFTWQNATAAHEDADVAAVPPPAVYPVDREHLDALVDQALLPVLGRSPQRDADGDIPIVVGSAVVFVRSHERTPVIGLFAEMVVEIGDLDAALHEVEALNREIPGVKFSLLGDRIRATVDEPALPFVPDHLRFLLAHLCRVVASHDRDLARRVDGRVFRSDPDSGDDPGHDAAADDGIHPVMLRLLQLDAERPGSLRPKIVAALCDDDPDLLVELIRWNEQQEIEWRVARDEARATAAFEEAEVCEVERAHAQRTVKILRKALRRVLLGQRSSA